VFCNVILWLKGKGKTVILVTHLQRYLEFADTQITLSNGKIVDEIHRNFHSEDGTNLVDLSSLIKEKLNICNMEFQGEVEEVIGVAKKQTSRPKSSETKVEDTNLATKPKPTSITTLSTQTQTQGQISMQTYVNLLWFIGYKKCMCILALFVF